MKTLKAAKNTSAVSRGLNKDHKIPKVVRLYFKANSLCVRRTSRSNFL